MTQQGNRLVMLRETWGDKKYVRMLSKVNDYLRRKAIENYTGDLPSPDMRAMMSAMYFTLDAIHVDGDERIFWEIINEQG